MPESLVQVTEGTGKKLHTWSSTVGANTVEDEFTIPGEYPYATYSAVGSSVSVATSSDHIIAINAGASLKVRIRSIIIRQTIAATTAGALRLQVWRTTTAAPTGGSAVTPNPYDTSDGASGATARTLPTAKGTESALLYERSLILRQAVSATSSPADDVEWAWRQSRNAKPLVIPAGTTNGIAVKVTTGVATATVSINVEFVETSY